MISKTDNTETFINNRSDLPEAPKWLGELRTKGFEKFSTMGLPTVKDEEWKYTNIASINKKTFSIPTKTQTEKDASLESYWNKAEINVVLVNGQFSEELSNLSAVPKGIEILTLDDAVSKHSKEIEDLFKKYDEAGESAFVALNKALIHSGVYVNVQANVQAQELIHIIHLTDTKEKDVVLTPRTFIVLSQSSEVTILESHLCFDNEVQYLTNAVSDIFLADNAILHYCKAQDESKKSYHIGTTRVWQERDTNFDGFSLMTGAAITRNDLNIIVNGEGSNANLHGLYCIGTDQHTDNHSNVDHKVPNCTSNQLYKGILTGNARAVFNGKIFVRDIAQQTNSYQLNKNLMMGTDCRVDTKPQLEIFADDVKCTHGATIGQLNKDELFYLKSRAIPKRDAVRMLARGFVDDIFDHIANHSICEKLNKLIEPTFERL